MNVNEPADQPEQSDTNIQTPASLFHYTNASGLLSILSNSKIWASDLRFLNDAQEAIYALDLFRRSLTEMENPALNPDHPIHKYSEEFGATFEGYKSMVAAEMGSPKFPVYVTCFCEFGDLLSQWRAYGSDHGYAIELKSSELDAAIRRISGYPDARMLMPVRYGVEAATAVLSTALQVVSEDTNLGHIGVHAHYMALRLSALLATVKHPGFKEEQEWRTIAAFEQYDRSVHEYIPALEEYDYDRNLLKFRSSSMAIVPYIEVPFPKEAVVSIRLGPGRHLDIRQQGVQRLLYSLDYEAEVFSSEVPLRS